MANIGELVAVIRLDTAGIWNDAEVIEKALEKIEKEFLSIERQAAMASATIRNFIREQDRALISASRTLTKKGTYNWVTGPLSGKSAKESASAFERVWENQEKAMSSYYLHAEKLERTHAQALKDNAAFDAAIAQKRADIYANNLKSFEKNSRAWQMEQAALRKTEALYPAIMANMKDYYGKQESLQNASIARNMKSFEKNSKAWQMEKEVMEDQARMYPIIQERMAEYYRKQEAMQEKSLERQARLARKQQAPAMLALDEKASASFKAFSYAPGAQIFDDATQKVSKFNNELLKVQYSSKKAQGFFSEMAERFANRIKFMIAQWGVLAATFGTAYGIFKFFQTGLKAVDDYKTDVASMTATTMTFMKLNPGETLAEGYGRAHRYASAIVPVLEKIAAETLLTGRETVQLATEFSKMGVFLDVNNKKQVEGLKTFSNALAIMTKGQDREKQILTEVRAMFGQGAKAGAMMLKMLKAVDPAIESHLKSWQKEGTVLENLLKLLHGYNKATGEIAKTWEAVSTTLSTTFKQITRAGSFDIYEEIMDALLRLDAWMQKHKNELRMGVAKAWMEIKSAAMTLWNILKGIAYTLKLIRDYAGGIDNIMTVLAGVLGVKLFKAIFGLQKPLYVITNGFTNLLPIVEAIRVALMRWWPVIVAMGALNIWSKLKGKGELDKTTDSINKFASAMEDVNSQIGWANIKLKEMQLTAANIEVNALAKELSPLVSSKRKKLIEENPYEYIGPQNWGAPDERAYAKALIERNRRLEELMIAARATQMAIDRENPPKGRPIQDLDSLKSKKESFLNSFRNWWTASEKSSAYNQLDKDIISITHNMDDMIEKAKEAGETAYIPAIKESAWKQMENKAEEYYAKLEAERNEDMFKAQEYFKEMVVENKAGLDQMQAAEKLSLEKKIRDIGATQEIVEKLQEESLINMRHNVWLYNQEWERNLREINSMFGESLEDQLGNLDDFFIELMIKFSDSQEKIDKIMKVWDKAKALKPIQYAIELKNAQLSAPQLYNETDMQYAERMNQLNLQLIPLLETQLAFTNQNSIEYQNQLNAIQEIKNSVQEFNDIKFGGLVDGIRYVLKNLDSMKTAFTIGAEAIQTLYNDMGEGFRGLVQGVLKGEIRNLEDFFQQLGQKMVEAFDNAISQIITEFVKIKIIKPLLTGIFGEEESLFGGMVESPYSKLIQEKTTLNALDAVAMTQTAALTFELGLQVGVVDILTASYYALAMAKAAAGMGGGSGGTDWFSDLMQVSYGGGGGYEIPGLFNYSGSGMAKGGWVKGIGGPTADKVPARLSAGEFIVNASAAGKYGDFLEMINSGMTPSFAGAGGNSSGAIYNKISTSTDNGVTINVPIGSVEGSKKTASELRQGIEKYVEDFIKKHM